MAPPKGARATTAQEAEDAFTTISKQKLAAQSHLAARGRRNGHTTSTMNGSGLKELAAASAAAQMNAQPAITTIGLDWSKEDSTLLHRYRSAHRLSVPSAFHNPMAHAILQSGIGPTSPTMARARSKRRIKREELAAIVRKNFKEAPVSENECIVDLLYKVKMKDKTFRLKFLAKPSR